MTDRNEAVANALELLMINQIGIGAAIEELAKWIAERGSTDLLTMQSQPYRCSTSTQMASLQSSACYVKRSHNISLSNVSNML